jgi:hypothetical protein
METLLIAVLLAALGGFFGLALHCAPDCREVFWTKEAPRQR